jgi:hypothetical protein
MGLPGKAGALMGTLAATFAGQLEEAMDEVACTLRLDRDMGHKLRLALASVGLFDTMEAEALAFQVQDAGGLERVACFLPKQISAPRIAGNGAIKLSVAVPNKPGNLGTLQAMDGERAWLIAKPQAQPDDGQMEIGE